MLHSVLPHRTEEFALRLLLRHFPGRSWEDLRTRNGHVFDSPSEAARAVGLVGSINEDAQRCVFEAARLGRAPSELRFLFVLLVRNGADYDSLFEHCAGDMADEDDSEVSLQDKIGRLMGSFDCPYFDHDVGGPVQLGPRSGADGLTDEQQVVCREIVQAVLGRTDQLMFLQGAAGTGKTFLVRTVIKMLTGVGKRCVVCAPTGIAAVQYEGGVTLHSLFKLGIDECIDDSFRCNIGRNSPHAHFLLETDLIIIDEVSMLTSWVAERVSRVLGWVADSQQMFGGIQVLFVGDLLQLPPVVPNFGMPVAQRLITRSPWWPVVRKFRIERPMRSTHLGWNRFLSGVACGRLGTLRKWSELRGFGVTVTEDPDVAFTFYVEEVRPDRDFPLNRQWIAATNRLANEINTRVQAWRKAGGAASLGVCRSRTDLLTPFPNCPRLPIQLQIDYIEALDTPDLPPSQFELLKGDVLLLLRNINTRAGLAKGKRCVATEMGQMTVVVCFDEDRFFTFARIRMEKTFNGVSFVRWQVPLKLVYAGTVHRSQGMTLERAVVDCRVKFWEHGQLYVAMSRVTSPRGLCVLLPPGMMESEIACPVDEVVVRIVERIGTKAAASDMASEADRVGPGESAVDPPVPPGVPLAGGWSDDELGGQEEEAPESGEERIVEESEPIDVEEFLDND
jgi:hypothetical protein